MWQRFMLKTLVNGVIVIPMLMWLGGATLWGSLITALALCVLAYVVGDLWVLRATNNMVATVADAGLAFVFLWAAAAMAGWDLTFMEILLISAAVGIAEWFLHGMMLKDRNIGMGRMGR